MCVKALVGAGGRVDKKDSAGNTPLMYTSREGHANTIRALITLGAKPSECNLTKETPIHFAARGGHLDSVNELLLMGASPNVRDSRGQSPLLLACKHRFNDVIQLLLDYHCDVNAQDTQTGKTSLHWAIQNGDSYTVTELLDAGTETNIRDKNWYTPFMLALIHSRRDIMELLLHAGSRVDVTDSNFNTALHLAARDGQTDLITLLIDAGIHVDIKGAGGLTPLMLAAFGGYVSIVGLLLKFGASVNMMDRNRATALTYAILSEAPDTSVHAIIKILIRMNCNMNKCANLNKVLDIIGLELGQLEERLYSPLEVAFLKGRAAVFMMLIHSGCDLDDFHCDKVHSVQEFRSLGPDLKNRWYLLRCLQKEKFQVRSLKQMCRRPVLESLSKIPTDGIQEQIAHMSVSDQLKAFLNFSDLENVEEMYHVNIRAKRRSGPGRLEGIEEEKHSKHTDNRRHTLSPSIAGSFRYTSDMANRRKSMTFGHSSSSSPSSEQSRRKSMYDSSGRGSTTISDDPLKRSSLMRSASLRVRSPSPETKAVGARSRIKSDSAAPCVRSRIKSDSSSPSVRLRIKSDSAAPGVLRRTNSMRLSIPSPTFTSQPLTRTNSMRLHSPSPTPVTSHTLPRSHGSHVSAPSSPGHQPINRASVKSPRQSPSPLPINRPKSPTPLSNGLARSVSLKVKSTQSTHATSQKCSNSKSTSESISKRRSLPVGYYTLRGPRKTISDQPLSPSGRPIRSILRNSTSSAEDVPEDNVQTQNVDHKIVSEQNNNNSNGKDNSFVTNGETGELTPCISPNSFKSPGASPVSPKKEVKFSLPVNGSNETEVIQTEANSTDLPEYKPQFPVVQLQ